MKGRVILLGGMMRVFAMQIGCLLLALAGILSPCFADKLAPAAQGVVLPLQDETDLTFNHLSVRDGLSQARASQIVQDDQGFLWFGTQYGLNRYDGYAYRVFTHDPADPDSMGGVYVESLFKDQQGALWVSCDHTLDKFDLTTEKFTHIHLPPPNAESAEPTVIHISQNKPGVLWLSTQGGLYRIRSDTGEIHRFAHNDADPASIGSDYVLSSGTDREGRFWVTSSSGLDQFDQESGKVVRHISFPPSYTNIAFHQDRGGRFWVIYGGGKLGLLDIVSGETTRYVLPSVGSGSKVAQLVYSMLEDADGSMWFGTSGNGLLKLGADHKSFLRYRHRAGDATSIGADRITTLFQDRDNRIWIGMHQAQPDFFILEKPLFESFGHETNARNNLLSSLVSAIYKDQSGKLWVATTGKVQRFDRKAGTWETVDAPFAGSDVLDIVQDRSGDFWFATSDVGLIHTDKSLRVLKRFRHQPNDRSTIGSDLVERLLIDHSGNLWAATWDGLSLFHPATQDFTTYFTNASFGSENFYAVTEDSAGKIWLGSNHGLSSFDPRSKAVKRYRHSGEDSTSLSDSRVNAIFFDRDGRTWVGTQNGLDLLDLGTGTFAHFFRRDGLAGNVVSCIREDAAGRLWMSTNRGMSALDPSAKRFTSYSQQDGLPGDDLTGWGACSSAADGEMFFGGFSGAVAFRAEQMRDRPYIPPVRLTDLQVGGSSVVPGDHSILKNAIGSTSEITLPHNQPVFSVSFAALGYLNAESNRYRYRLDGLDTGWNEVASSRRFASYTTLPAGTYTLHVQAATVRGQWSDPGATLAIRILPAWWTTLPFEMLYGITLLLVLAALYLYRVEQVSQRFKMRMEERVSERTRIARELHDNLLQGFQGLVLYFQSAASLLPARSEARVAMEEAIGIAERTLKEGRESVQGLRAGTENLTDLATSLSGLGSQLNPSGEVIYRVSVGENSEGFDPALSNQIFHVAKEAVTNAFLHSAASLIEVTLSSESRIILLVVKDNGSGFDPSNVNRDGDEGHYGLMGMRERARQIGGSLDIQTAIGIGTVLRLQVKLKHSSWGPIGKASAN